ncbi:hypothetical protein EGR52_12675 [bacterium]|nr:hypothetical protein [bacterium]
MIKIMEENLTICTEDALKLLVKYKPTSLNDRANISGIGDNFIDNYGTFFYKLKILFL